MAACGREPINLDGATHDEAAGDVMHFVIINPVAMDTGVNALCRLLESGLSHDALYKKLHALPLTREQTSSFMLEFGRLSWLSESLAVSKPFAVLCVLCERVRFCLCFYLVDFTQVNFYLLTVPCRMR